MLDPLVILAIGIVAVIGMILVLRLNAFIALITAAMLVSLLSPGALGAKIARVAVAFGDTAAGIGIVIAMAAVIGKCLMDSGAADRIVRSFLRVLGEKRASVALMGSGFVLAVPVFFDTVFYLLVPLARSLWKRTRKNYVLYITAIATGGAITHTLVPPTPGPLLMADNLGIDLGLMIVVGSLIGLPTAIVGLLVCKLMNRLLDLPMRSLGSEPDPDPLADEELPSLWVSLLPVVLPVVLISANTLTKMQADAEHAELVRQGDVLDWPALCSTLGSAETADAPRAARVVREMLPADLRRAIVATSGTADCPARLQERLQAAVAQLTVRGDLYKERVFTGIELSDAAEKIRAAGAGKLSKDEKGLDELTREELAMANLSEEQLRQFNWMLLEAAFPGQTRQTPLRRAAGVTALLGNPNLALTLSAALAMLVLLRKRRLRLGQLAHVTENALMSGGVIILITAAGGAFGKMLRQCGVEQSIKQMVELDSQGVGITILCLAFAIGAVMKVAQGSGTVSMIVTSGIMASMGVSSAMLGCDVVYLAAAIGCGSLTGSWMNDSGFWIFARMSGLTEIEALKTWTILLAILGVVGLGFTLLGAWALPLV